MYCQTCPQVETDHIHTSTSKNMLNPVKYFLRQYSLCHYPNWMAKRNKKVVLYRQSHELTEEIVMAWLLMRNLW